MNNPVNATHDEVTAPQHGSGKGPFTVAAEVATLAASWKPRSSRSGCVREQAPNEIAAVSSTSRMRHPAGRPSVQGWADACTCNAPKKTRVGHTARLTETRLLVLSPEQTHRPCRFERNALLNNIAWHAPTDRASMARTSSGVRAAKSFDVRTVSHFAVAVWLVDARFSPQMQHMLRCHLQHVCETFRRTPATFPLDYAWVEAEPHQLG